MTTLTYTEQLVVISCFRCGVNFGMPTSLNDECHKDHGRSFYCPNGHGQVYAGKTEAQKLKDELEAERRRRASREEQLQAERDAREHAEAQARGYKGAMVQARKRSAKGVCPAPGCKRSFVDVAKHVATKHPELVADAEHAHG